MLIISLKKFVISKKKYHKTKQIIKCEKLINICIFLSNFFNKNRISFFFFLSILSITIYINNLMNDPHRFYLLIITGILEDKPPSTVNAWPFIYELSSLAKNNVAFATY